MANADVLASGREREPRRSPPRRLLLAGALALAVLGAWVVLRGGGETPAPPGLALVETGGEAVLGWSGDGTVDLSLPVLVRNDGAAAVVTAMRLEGTELAHPLRNLPLAAGGRLPVALRTAVRCPSDVVAPDDPVVALDVMRDRRTTTTRLPLTDTAAASLTDALGSHCRRLPLANALVVRGEQLDAQGDTVLVRVQVDNVGGRPLQLLGLSAAGGLSLTLVPDGVAAAPRFPFELAAGPATFTVAVALRDCDPRRDQVPVAIGDVGFEDALGTQAVVAVRGDLDGVLGLYEQRC